MDWKLVFGADGVLRVQSYYDDRVAVPAKLIQQQRGLSDYSFFIRELNTVAILEAGSTVGSFLLCLEPWVDAVSDLTQQRVAGYITELRKPSAEEPAFDRVELRKRHGLSQEMFFEPNEPGSDFLSRLNDPDREPPKYLNSYEVDSTGLGATGYKNGDDSNYSVSYNSIHSLKNVPLIVNPRPLISFWYHANPRGMLKRLPGIQKVGKYMQVVQGASEQYTLIELIQGVIEDGLFFADVSGGTATSDELKEMISELDLPEEVEETPTQETQADKPIKIVFAPDAFAPMLRHADRCKAEWQEIVQSIATDAKFPLRIGQIKEDTPVDNRGFGQIFKEGAFE